MRAAEVREIADGVDFGPASLGPIAVITEGLAGNTGTVTAEQRARILQQHNCLARTRGRKRYPERELLVIGRVDRLRQAHEAASVCLRGESEARIASVPESAPPRRPRQEPRPPPCPPPCKAPEPPDPSSLPPAEIPQHDSWTKNASELLDSGANALLALAPACSLKIG
ncbi:unnamed protein product [Prorocentrum cordatum]|uniref:Uncharacterized protein n=1 Tax=Prorocentrum cordatum TaxID=2364126 RepID=A0ABN9XS48_9DINO|nr:unnamed protein product [Polarella glacialis]